MVSYLINDVLYNIEIFTGVFLFLFLSGGNVAGQGRFLTDLLKMRTDQTALDKESIK